MFQIVEFFGKIPTHSTMTINTHETLRSAGSGFFSAPDLLIYEKDRMYDPLAAVTSDIIERAQNNQLDNLDWDAVIYVAQYGRDEEAETAFSITFAHFQPLILRYTRNFFRNTEDTKDFTQEVFLRLWQKLPQARPGSKVRPWLYRIATNVCLDELRHRKVVEIVPWTVLTGTRSRTCRTDDTKDTKEIFDFGAQNSNSNTSENEYLRLENQERVWRTLELLNPQYSEIIKLRYFLNLSYEEIAKLLDRSEKAARDLLCRALKQFAQKWDSGTLINREKRPKKDSPRTRKDLELVLPKVARALEEYREAHPGEVVNLARLAGEIGEAHSSVYKCYQRISNYTNVPPINERLNKRKGRGF